MKIFSDNRSFSPKIAQPFAFSSLLLLFWAAVTPAQTQELLPEPHEDVTFKSTPAIATLPSLPCSLESNESTANCHQEAQYLSQEAPEASTDADEPIIPGEFSTSITFTTNYKFRGISQSDNKPSIQGTFDYSLPVSEEVSVYAGVFAGSVDLNPGDGATVEIDFYGGAVYQATEKLYLDFGGSYYFYPGVESNLNYNYFEAYVNAGYDLDVAQVTASLYYAPNFFGGTDDGLYLGGGVEVPLPENFFAMAEFGHQSISNNTLFAAPDYFHWGLGVGYVLGDFTLLLQYLDSTLSSQDCFGGRDICEGRIVFSISR
ncbi:MAG: TorF family putative porin [Jaaginema sp. PMC 1079.18]|nr:TorF family putative porin [Jaaginema sp. PMC 1080.18]MEC4850956.1 TorF family putative porin [Jaaginema sp. PMC 1079.18]MEC4867771.1 TorF family putative porin [Jaaginema sp. PMC 1078.18]